MKQLLGISLVALLFFSCTKKDSSTPYDTATPAPTTPTYTIADYTKLTTGNYWVYEIVNVDTLGNATPAGTDSCYIEKDTMIKGNTYAELINYPFTGTEFLRDSASFLLDQDDNALFTLSYFNVELYQDSIPGAISIYSVPNSQVVITVPAGTYTCYDFMGTVTIYTKGYKWGNPRYSGYYYSAGVGLVEAINFYISQPGTVQYRLLRAKVN